MQNWTDKIIHWNQLPGTEVKRLLATWGKDQASIDKYDRKYGFVNVPAKPITKTEATVPAKATKKATTVVAKKSTVATTTRQKHTGADGEIKFVAHRNLYVGFMGGKVAVTKRTADACRAVVLDQFRIEGVKVDA